MTGRVGVEVPHNRIAEFCRHWRIMKLSLFGSALREDFRPDSDVDVLVTFAPDTRWSLFDIAHMQSELEAIFGRAVDLGEKSWVEGSENLIRRRAILDSLVPIYAA